MSEVRLPEAARARVLALAAETLPKLAPAEVPPTLRHVAGFTPTRRARLAAAPLAAALESEPAFRQEVAAAARVARPELAAALDAGTPPPAAAPEDVAALAYLLRPAGWERLVADAAEALDLADRRAAAEADAATAARLAAELDAERVARRSERDAARTELEAARAEIAALRRAVKAAQDAQRRAEAAARRAGEELAAARTEAATAATAAETAARRQRARVTELEAALEAARRAGREARAYDDTRVWLLLDTLAATARGLREELAVPPPAERPGDRAAAVLGADPTAVPAAPGAPGPAGPAVRGRSPEDPSWLEALLRVPGVHVVVDGYNVTKTAYGELPLEAQRNRLVTGLRALSARTRAEVTCVFDGAEVGGAMPATSTRGVRVHFTQPGRTADEVIAAFVGAEPAGRPLVVVSSDREVAEAARRAGAHAVPSSALVAVLGRG